MFSTTNNPASNTEVNFANYMVTAYKIVFQQTIILLGNIAKKMCYHGPVMKLLIKYEVCTEQLVRVLLGFISDIAMFLQFSAFSGSGFFEPS